MVGAHFFSPPPGSEFKLTSLSDKSRAHAAQVHFVDDEHLELEWPASVFAIGEQVKLSLSLDGGIVYQSAPRALTVYGGIKLQRARPLRLYRWQDGESVQ